MWDIIKGVEHRLVNLLKKAAKNPKDILKSLKDDSDWKAPADTEDNAALEALRNADAVDPARPPIIAVIGVTKAGKSQLLCKLFGDDDAFLTKASIDTTDKLFRTALPNGLVVVDTPGVGGDKDFFENVTRLYMGIPQIVEHDELAEGDQLHKVTELPVCKIGNQKKCPLRVEVPLELDGKSERQIVLPLAYEETNQRVWGRMYWAEGKMCREHPQIVHLRGCNVANQGKPCVHLVSASTGSQVFKDQQPDVIIILAAGPRGGFHRSEYQFIKNIKATPLYQKVVFAVNMWSSQDAVSQSQVLAKVEEQAGEGVVSVDASSGRGVKDLVQRILERLPQQTATKFNAALVEKLRESKDALAGTHIVKAAGQCGLLRTDATVHLGGTEIPECHKVLHVLLNRIADIHRIPDSVWQNSGGDYEALVNEVFSPERFARIFQESGIQIEIDEEITVPEVREKTIRIPRTGVGGYLSRTWFGELFDMDQYEEAVQTITVNVVKHIKRRQMQPGRGGAEAIRLALEVGLRAHCQMWRASQKKRGNGTEINRIPGHVDTLLGHLGSARLNELCLEGSEKKIVDYLQENLPKDWLEVRR